MASIFWISVFNRLFVAMQTDPGELREKLFTFSLLQQIWDQALSSSHRDKIQAKKGKEFSKDQGAK